MAVSLNFELPNSVNSLFPVHFFHRTIFVPGSRPFRGLCTGSRDRVLRRFPQQSTKRFEQRTHGNHKTCLDPFYILFTEYLLRCRPGGRDIRIKGTT